MDEASGALWLIQATCSEMQSGLKHRAPQSTQALLHLSSLSLSLQLPPSTLLFTLPYSQFLYPQNHVTSSPMKMKLLPLWCLYIDTWKDIHNFKLTFNSSIYFPCIPHPLVILWSNTVRNCATSIRYSCLPSYNYQTSIYGGIVMVTAQGVEFTDWLGRHEERDINDRRAPYRVSGQWLVLESPVAFCRVEMIRQRVPEGVFNRWLETGGK